MQVEAISLVDETMSDRDLVRTLRVGVSVAQDVMPESLAWQAFLELRKRGEPRANQLFLGALRSLHGRRCIAGSSLCTNDIDTTEHRMAQDPMLAELWRAYKKCIRNNRTGPASELLKEIEGVLA
jgi:hypothetical protein